MGLSIEDAIARFEPELPLAVALSGGADSTALLVACARRWPGQVMALHVHHGLQEAADEFERACTVLCASLGVPLRVCRVDARHAPGESPEDAARRARYKALADAAREEGSVRIRSVALAHHADDQVETLLLALSRGAGLAGLAGMRPAWDADGVRHYRPLLQVAAADIRAWLAGQGIRWVEDPMNADPTYTRSRIRHAVLPALDQAFATWRDTFARSARHAAQAQALLEEVAAQDLGMSGESLQIAVLRSWSRARQTNALRHWLRTRHGTQATGAQMDELLDQIEACSTRGHRIRIKVGTGFVERREGSIVFIASV
jgi:tRNA(Ile)-lysidine synthase